MKYLPDFQFYKVNNLSAYKTLLNQCSEEVTIVSGGTDLVVKLKSRNESLSIIVDISDIAVLRGIEEDNDYIIIGSATTHTDIATNNLIIKYFPFLAEAARSVGSLQIRNSGTIGGNIANCCPAGDTLGPLIALDAEIVVAKKNNGFNEDSYRINEIFEGSYKTKLQPGDLITKIVLKKLPAGTGTSFLKVGRRNALSISRLSVAVLLTLDSEKYIKDVRIAPGAVLSYPKRIAKTEEYLMGKQVTSSYIFETAGQITAEEVLHITGVRDSTPYKNPVLNNLTFRGLSIAHERCNEYEG